MRSVKWLPLVLCAACSPIVEQGSLVITSLELGDVESDTVLAPGLEVEVHLYENTSSGKRFIGCAGPDTGLGGVTSGKARYTLDAHFLHPTGGDRTVTINELTGTDYFVVVSEDDEASCPAEQDATVNTPILDDQDDLIGQSQPFTKTALSAGVKLVFSPVLELQIAPAAAGE